MSGAGTVSLGGKSVQPSHSQGCAIRPDNGVRLLAVRHGLPLTEGIGGHQAAPKGQRAPEHAGRGDRLGPGVDRPAGGIQVFREVRHQAPAQHVQAPLSGLRVPPHDHGRLGGRHIPARAEVRQLANRVEQAGDFLGGQMAGVASAHRGSVPRFRAVRLSGTEHSAARFSG
jgi:hypothetical protein